MKTLFILPLIILCISFTSCLDDDDAVNFFYEGLPIATAELPEELVKDSTYTIKVSYFRPTSCHLFEGFDYQKNRNERTISAIALVSEATTCETYEEPREEETSFKFLVGTESSYIFKFWQGRATDGSSKFLIIEVPTAEAKVKN
ncbi:hypothetical protein [Aquimarina intermedia]|uniref:Lipoprotein n=1 Tax=Aquimarina intermedia TaxID=350814 RepID=A0A5S5CA40_9FLAO|nr:hypothetical protein [Aquimarina intermedia]TYP76265.1 hypothetical protein BD809_102483 [Aquimarina intermedia]